jgi:hypothetical protein
MILSTLLSVFDRNAQIAVIRNGDAEYCSVRSPRAVRRPSRRTPDGARGGDKLGIQVAKRHPRPTATGQGCGFDTLSCFTCQLPRASASQRSGPSFVCDVKRTRRAQQTVRARRGRRVAQALHETQENEAAEPPARSTADRWADNGRSRPIACPTPYVNPGARSN